MPRTVVSFPPPAGLRSLAQSTRIYRATVEDALAVVAGFQEDHPDLAERYGSLIDELRNALRPDLPGSTGRLVEVLADLLGER